MSQPKKPGRYRYRLRADSTWARFFDQEWHEVDVHYIDGMWAGVGGSACIPILHHEWEWIGPLEKVGNKPCQRCKGSGYVKDRDERDPSAGVRACPACRGG